MDRPITYVGLDVHKDTIAVAVAGNRGEVRACRDWRAGAGERFFAVSWRKHTKRMADIIPTCRR